MNACKDFGWMKAWATPMLELSGKCERNGHRISTRVTRKCRDHGFRMRCHWRHALAYKSSARIHIAPCFVSIVDITAVLQS